MNERLLIEIVERADENCELAMIPADTLIKFAELIVRECYDIAYDGDGILEYFGIDK